MCNTMCTCSQDHHHNDSHDGNGAHDGTKRRQRAFLPAPMPPSPSPPPIIATNTVLSSWIENGGSRKNHQPLAGVGIVFKGIDGGGLEVIFLLLS